MSVSINLPINDLMQSVERPVVMDVIRQLQARGVFPQLENAAPIRFYGEDGKAAQYNSTITKDQTTNNLWPHQENLTIEVDEDHDENNAFAMAVQYPDNRYVFADNALTIGMRPAYSHTQVVVRILYKAVDKNQATKWRNELRTRFAMLRDSFMFDITYSYHVPDAFIFILQELFRLRQNIAPYPNEDFGDYLRKYGSSRMTSVSNQIGVDTFLAVAEKQTQVQGFFDFDMVPEKAAKDDEPNLWVTSMSFKFAYDKPIEMVMNYPIMVHQQLLSSKFRPTDEVESYYSVIKKLSYSWENFIKFTAYHDKLRYQGNRGLVDPPEDTFRVNGAPVACVRAYRTLLSINPTDLRDLINLGDLGDFNLDPDVLAFMKASEYQYMAVPYNSIFQLHHYEGGRIKEQDGLSVDADLNVRLTYDANLRQEYRLRLGLVVRMEFLPAAAVQRLRNNPVVAVKVLRAINASIRDLGHVPDIAKSRLTDRDLAMFGCVYDQHGCIVVGDATFPSDDNRIIWGLVESLFVVANRMPPNVNPAQT